MASRRVRKHDKQLLTGLANMPWQANVAFAIIVYAVMRWLIPMQFQNTLLLPLATVISGYAPMAALLFLLIGAISFIRNRGGNTHASAKKDYLPYAPILEDTQTSSPPIIKPGSNTSQQKTTSSASSDSGPVATAWSLELLQSLEWKRFELVCAEYFMILGKRVQTIPHGADGGIDARVYKNGSDVLEYAIQCKAWNSLVGVKPIRELFGVMAHESAGKGVFMTTSRFSEEAIKFAADHSDKLFLVNGEKFLSMLLLLPEDKQKQLLQQATSGDYTTPSCASCGTKMVRRPGKSGDFWGCTNYPKCRSTLKIATA